MIPRISRSLELECIAVREAFIASLIPINQSPLYPPQGIANPGSAITLHPDLIQAPQIARFVQVTTINPPNPPKNLQPKALSGL